MNKFLTLDFYHQFFHNIEIDLFKILLAESLIVAGLIISLYLASKILKFLENRFQKTSLIWDDIIIASLKKPIYTVMVGLSIPMMIHNANIFSEKFSQRLIKFGEDFFVSLAICWFLMGFVNQYVKRYVSAKRSLGQDVDYASIDGISKLVKFLIFIAFIIVLMDIFGVNVKGILAAAGIGGIAIGFASKDLLANFFGTSIIYLDQPFKIGDWIKSPDKDIEGTVEEIGWRMTKIRRFDKRPIYVPNSLFLTMAIENPSRMTHRRIRSIIGIRYEDMGALDDITKQVKQMLIDHPEIDTNQTLIVHFEEFADWSVNFLIYTFTYTTNWVRFYEIQQDVMNKVYKIIEDNKASIAFPTSDLNITGSLQQRRSN